MLSLLTGSPLLFLFFVVVFVMSISAHEFAHALAADLLGDPTPRYSGRLTLNPLAHLDFLGTVLILLVRFGWGKPVPINSANFKKPLRDSAVVSIAGPTANFILAVVFALVLHLLPVSYTGTAFIYLIIVFNLTLGIFNLLPIFPLDGFTVVQGLLPIDLAMKWEGLRSYGVYILLILIVTGTTGFLILAPVGFVLKLLGL